MTDERKLTMQEQIEINVATIRALHKKVHDADAAVAHTYNRIPYRDALAEYDAFAPEGAWALIRRLDEREARIKALETALTSVSDMLSMAAHDAEGREEHEWAAILLEKARQIDTLMMPQERTS